MNKFTLALMSILLTTSALIAKETDVSHTIVLTDPSKPANIRVELTSGTITVEGYDGKTIEVRAVVSEMKKVDDVVIRDISSNARIEREVMARVTGRTNIDQEVSEKQQKDLTKGLKLVKNKSIHLQMDEYNNNVSIESESRTQNIALTIRVPYNSNLELENQRGDGITINNVYGSIEAESHRGSILATGIRGPIVAETGRSDITVIFDRYNETQPSSFAVHRGNLDITLPKISSVNFEVKNYQGDIYSGFDVEFKSLDKVTSGKNSKRQKGMRQTVTVGGGMTASINGGKQKLLLNTYQGDIYLRSK